MARRAKPLVCGHLEKVSRSALEKYQAVIRQYVRGKNGVYALYRGERLKYVGLATDLRNRLRAHLRDRHAQSWDKFSLYLTRDDEHLRELEALVIRMAAPRENRQKTRFSSSEDLSKRFRRDIHQSQKEEIKEIFGIEEFEKTPRKKPKKKGGKTPAGKLFAHGYRKIYADYKGKRYYAKLGSTGRVRFEGKLYNSPSMAGRAITGKPVNGWKFWRYKNERGEWVYIDELRKG